MKNAKANFFCFVCAFVILLMPNMAQAEPAYPSGAEPWADHSVGGAGGQSHKIVNGDFSYKWNEISDNGYLNPLTGATQPFSFDQGAQPFIYSNANPRVRIAGGWNRNLFGWGVIPSVGSPDAESTLCSDGKPQISMSIPNNVFQFVNSDGYKAVELSANVPGVIYQDIAAYSGTVYRWTVSHRPTDEPKKEKVAVRIGAPGAETHQMADRISSGGSDPNIKVAYLQSSGFWWNTYTGVYKVPGTAGKNNFTTTRFRFEYADGLGDTRGNLVANISLNIAYPFRFDLNGGSGSAFNPEAENYKGYIQEGTTATLSSLYTSVPTRPGYTFMGWSESRLSPATTEVAYNQNRSKVITSLKATNRAGHTLYAVWAKNPTVTFKNGNTTLKTQTVAPGANATAPANPAKTGYLFRGWQGKYQKVYADSVVTSVFNPITYKVAFNANSGSGAMNTQQFTYDKPQALSANAFKKTGYHFVGWNTRADGKGTSYKDKQQVNNLTVTNGSTINLYAQWQPNTYYIEFRANGGSGTMQKMTCTYDKAYSLTQNAFTRKGYVYKGWAGSDGKTYADMAAVKNLTAQDGATIYMTAQWKLNQVIVSIPTKIAFDNQAIGKVNTSTSFKVYVDGDFTGDVVVRGGTSILSSNVSPLNSVTSSSKNPLIFSSAGTSKEDTITITGITKTSHVYEGQIGYVVEYDTPE